MPATEDAMALAGGFDLRALPPDFYDDPFPIYRALRETRSGEAHAGRRASS